MAARPLASIIRATEIAPCLWRDTRPNRASQGGLMRQSQWIAAFALAATLAGCGRAPATPIYRIQTNIGIQGVMPGDEAGYFITANVGATYRLVWTGDVNQTAVFRNLH